MAIPFYWSKFGSQDVRDKYAKMYAARERMRDVGVADFQKAFVDGDERLEHNKCSREYESALWNERELLIGKFLREPDFKGGPGTDSFHAFLGHNDSWKSMNSGVDWRRIDTLIIQHHPYTGLDSIYETWTGPGGSFGLELPGFNRDETIELTADEFWSEFKRVSDKLRLIGERAMGRL